ncbi:MAG: twin-arginine translocase TatA/TatE family subunit [Methylobacterium sp.]|jgi:sec-independent protein translocase protein TatA|uniref:twin-arginine translocase TatA/TatE family subunit n=1 Tax=unclassified Methylobacterium TaxID=2615210 RepID=UPI0006F7B657|nr:MULTISPECIES: twin-arginine translocase TatA/TatE family subunit [unclassified Methylobacterium]KQP06012.1 preprotein translocase subunit TatA [Methylobacterium sp. Leaf99]MDO9428145.1 twin-arginine translocase TatA/TatE family subunit [Methylobacterium sp.]TXM78230.1 twin-arginine translocase TatA/TatE family subunit [Methylobacterium sp. WL69]
MGSMSIWHWIIVAGIVMLLFGRGKISDLMGDVAKGIKAFKKGMAEDEAPTAVPPPSAGEPVRTLPHQGEPATANPVAADRKVV